MVAFSSWGGWPSADRQQGHGPGAQPLAPGLSTVVIEGRGASAVEMQLLLSPVQSASRRRGGEATGVKRGWQRSGGFLTHCTLPALDGRCRARGGSVCEQPALVRQDRHVN